MPIQKGGVTKTHNCVSVLSERVETKAGSEDTQRWAIEYYAYWGESVTDTHTHEIPSSISAQQLLGNLGMFTTQGKLTSPSSLPRDRETE